MSKVQAVAILGSLVASASAHGLVQGIVAGGKWYQGYSPSFQYANPPPTVIGWSIPEDQDNGFVPPSSYSDPDIICHKGATPGGASAKVEAGSIVELQWTDWPESHHGPVIDYLAKCSGSCTDADKTSLEFFKIDAGGLIDGSSPPGTWASDQLIANNQSWVVTIPKSIAPGNYVLRHEIIALHSAGNEDGAQNYPQCINLEITGSGSDSPSGTLGTALYKADDPGILINIYTELSSYKIPGPSLIAGAVSMKQTTIPFNGAGTISTAPAASDSSSPIASATSVPSEAGSSAAPSGSASAPSSSAAAVSSSAAPPSYGAPAPSSSVAAPASGSDSAIVTDSFSLSSSAAPVSSSAPCTHVITVTGKPSSSSVAAPVSSSGVVVPSSSSISAPPLPSSGPASYIAPAESSSVAPSSAASSAAPAPSGPPAPPPPKYPADKPIPEGFTFGDLLAWLKYTVRVVFNKGSKKHARDFRIR